jgi:hypothetical protein
VTQKIAPAVNGRSLHTWRPRGLWQGAVLFLALALPAFSEAVAPSNYGFYTLTPCRAVDTRNPGGPYGGPALVANSDRSFQVTGRCGVPSTATAVVLNLAVTDATSAGNLRLYPTGYALPNASGINYRAAKVRANNGNYALNANGYLSVRCDQASGSVQLIVDVFGYFESAAVPPPPPPPPPPGSGLHIWSTHFEGTHSANDSASPVGVVVDSSGASVALGYLKGRADFGGGFLTSAGAGDIYLVKRASDGSYVWSQRFGSTEDDRPKGIAIDAGGNILITGYFRGTMSFGGAALTAAPGTANGFLAKYSPSGAHLWSKRLAAGSNTDAGNAVAVDGGGNVFVGAGLFGTSDFGGGQLGTAGGEDIVLAKYSSAGSHLWSKRIGGSSSDIVASVAVDTTTGEVVATGNFTGTVNFGGGAATSAGGNDAFVARYSSSGVHAWSRRWGSAADDKGAGVAVDRLGNVAVTGAFTNNVDFGGGPITNLGGTSSADIFLVKLSPAGLYLWSKGFGNALSSGQAANGVAFDGAGNVLLTGSIVALTSPYTIDFGGGPLTGDGWFNVFLAKFSSGGSHTWSKRYLGGGSNATGRAIAADNGDNVVATGDFQVSENFGGTTMTNSGATATYLVKLGP